MVGDLVEQFGGERVVERFVGPFEDGLGGLGGRVGGGLGCTAGAILGRAAVAKLAVGLVAVEKGDVDRGGIPGNTARPASEIVNTPRRTRVRSPARSRWILA